MRPASCIAVLAVALVSAVAGGPAAIAARQQAAPTFRSGVELIQLDVSVLDNARRPVHGLSAPDFTVRVDGVVRPVVAFKAVTLPPPVPPAPAPWVRDVAPDVVTNTHPGGRAVVILIDDNTVPTISNDPAWWMTKARTIARKVVDQLGPDDLAGVVFSVYNRSAQGFTNDRQLLSQAIDRAALFPTVLLGGSTGTTGPAATGDQNGCCYCGLCSVEVLANVAESLRSLPQQRKILMYISSGVGIAPDIRDPCNMRRRDAQFAALRKAALANVTIQPIDPAGLAVGAALGIGSPVEYLRTMAEQTGGRAVVGDNDMDLKVPEILAESSSYYLLGVESPGVVHDGRFHAIAVSVARPDVEVRTRNGYYDPTAKERKAAAASAAARDLDGSIEGVLPKRDFPLDVGVAPFSSGRESALAIVLGATHPIPRGDGATPGPEPVELLARLFNPETGRLVGTRRMTMTVHWDQTDGAGYYEVLTRMPAKAGRYELRVGLKRGDGRTASVYTFADVPDFRGGALSLSGLVLNAVPMAAAAPRDEFAEFTPVLPTARRQFRSTDRVTGFLRVYQKRWSPAVLRLRITDAHNVVRIARTASIGPPGRGGEGAEYRVDVPIAELTEGEYLLAVDVEAAGRTAHRTAPFRVE